MRRGALSAVAMAVALGLVAVVSASACQDADPLDFQLPAQLPNEFPGPVFSLHIGLITQFIPAIKQYETPIQVRITSTLDALAWDSVATYNKGKKLALTKRAPWVKDVPEELHTEAAHVLGAFYAWFAVVDKLVVPSDDLKVSLTGFAGAFGLEANFDISPEVHECTKLKRGSAKRSCFTDLACKNGYSPKIIGMINAAMARRWLRGDGWNADGKLASNGKRCTANCLPFTDPTGYTPVNFPGTTSHPNNWQPLLEEDGRGFYFRQEHVTPHIGTTAVTRTISKEYLERKNSEIADPEYDYDLEATKAMRRMKNLDDVKKMQIETFDDKIGVALTIFQSILMKHPYMTYGQFVLFFTGFTAGEYDSVLQSWKAKVHFDMVRPTTVVQRLGDGEQRIRTWAGPFKGVKTFKSGDWQPYVRTMPHSEFPSGSGCICTVIQEYTELFLKEFFNDETDLAMQVQIPAGGSRTEPGAVPAQDLTIELSSLEHMRDICGESRLDGGMHFTASVPASYELCTGTGGIAFDYIKEINGGVEV